MMSKNTVLTARLKESCRKTGACWAVCLARDDAGWVFDASYKLSRVGQGALLKDVEQTPMAAWVAGALGSGRVRSRSQAEDSSLGCKKIYLFPQANRRSLLMVAVRGELAEDALAHWKETARTWLLSAADSEEKTALSLANTFAQSISNAGSIEHAVSQSFYFIQRTFSATFSMLGLFSSDETHLTVFRSEPKRRKLIQEEAVMAEPLAALAGLERPMRYELAAGLPASPFFENCSSGVIVPLQYRGSELGFLLVDIPKKRAVSDLDLNLISLVAVQLAALAEYLCMRDEAEEHERYMQETVEQLQEIQQELQARIGAQRDAELRLIQAAKLAAVGEMAAGVAHELNNPLTTVVGFTELLLEDALLPESAHADLDMVLREAMRARNVVRRLLDFSRQSESSRTRADLNEIINDVLMLTKHLMRTSSVELSTNLQENLPWAQFDRNQIKQVIINLVNNAIYAMPRGGTLQVATEKSTRYNHSWIKLVVQDNGIGIPPDAMQRIFEPFYTTRGDKGGTGLGLSVTYGIITDHGGSIEVESQVEKGSSFTVWLPLEETE